MAAAKKKTTTRKKRTTKKKVAETASYSVKMTKDEAGSPEETEKTVTAPDAETAVNKAQASDPKKGQYDSVEVTKDNGGGGRVRTQPQTSSQTAAKTQGMAGFESVRYPYNVGVPQGFKPLVEALPKKLRESLDVSVRYSRLHISVPNAEVMETFMGELEKKAGGKSKVKSFATTVSEGIKRNIS